MSMKKIARFWIKMKCNEHSLLCPLQRNTLSEVEHMVLWCQGCEWIQSLSLNVFYTGVVIPIKLTPFFSAECLSSDSTVYRPTYPSLSVGNVIPDVPACHTKGNGILKDKLFPFPQRVAPFSPHPRLPHLDTLVVDLFLRLIASHIPVPHFLNMARICTFFMQLHYCYYQQRK